ncbi:hypothetical protein KP806_21495 [Paenibacillus sp. N4]|uniref:hypothetical protein n=1 Tax=Paenibacillus vietnamensis TaxID=2590547 RepID=UPI001CD0D41E|nr:hypothetical protein [Paenibacillus vietnamensis]MCA0757641.1 hypothetical protein [Paenibacillus vietnamensis]
MTKKQVIYSTICSLVIAAALDLGLFAVLGALLMLQTPDDFDSINSNNYFVVIHYQFVWYHYLIEVAAVFGMFAVAAFFLNRKHRWK